MQMATEYECVQTAPLQDGAALDAKQCEHPNASAEPGDRLSILEVREVDGQLRVRCDRGWTSIATESGEAQFIPATAEYQNKRFGKALHAWDEAAGADPNDLQFKQGAIIELTSDKPGKGWSTGMLDGRQSIFPSNFVEEIVRQKPKRYRAL